MMIETIDRQTNSAVVTHRIRQIIREQNLKPGDRLPTEQEMAERFGVSRISVREATKALSFLGIINSAPKRGTTVGQMDLGRLGEMLDFHAMVSGYSARQLLDARMIIEIGVLPAVAEKMRREPELYETLYALTTRPRIIHDLDTYVECDIEFHEELVKSGGVEPLEVFHMLLSVFFERCAKSTSGTRRARETGLRYHRRIIACLRDGRVSEAQDVLRRAFGEYHKTLRDR